MTRKNGCAMLLAAVLLLGCVGALAQETAPLAVTQQESAHAEQLRPFGKTRSLRGVAASGKWLYQAKLGNSFLNLRMYTTEGEQIVFQEKLVSSQTGGMQLLLRAGERGANLMLQMDQAAISTLIRLGVTEIVVADTDLYVQAKYLTADLDALRSRFHVGEKELLCVSGETQPVTVVGVDGVRRHITQ